MLYLVGAGVNCIALLALRSNGTSKECPDGEWWIATLKSSGWTILWSEDESFVRTQRDLISKLSIKRDVIACEVNETSMWCSSEYFSAGHSLWTISHAGDGSDKYDLTATGHLPEGFEEIKEKHFAEQKEDEEVDLIFEIPLEIARNRIGFRHEDYLEAEHVDVFVVIESPKKKGLYQRRLLMTCYCPFPRPD